MAADFNILPKCPVDDCPFSFQSTKKMESKTPKLPVISQLRAGNLIFEKLRKNGFRPDRNLLEIISVQSIHSYRYRLITTYECRKIEDRSQLLGEGPNKAQTNMHHKIASLVEGQDLWKVELPSSNKDAICEFQLEHSEQIKECPNCSGHGHLVCKSCAGIGSIRCIICDGRGYKMDKMSTGIHAPINLSHHHNTDSDRSLCLVCSKTGKRICDQCTQGNIICVRCKGEKHFLCFKSLVVRHSTREFSFESSIPENLPYTSVATAPRGIILLEEESKLPNPLQLHVLSEKKVKDTLSTALGLQTEGKRAVGFNQKVEIILVYRVEFEYNGSNGYAYIFGSNSNVHLPTVPSRMKRRTEICLLM